MESQVVIRDDDEEAEDRKLKSALDALGIDDDPELNDVPLDQIVAALKKIAGGDGVRTGAAEVVEEMEAMSVLEYMQEGADDENEPPTILWLRRWGLSELLSKHHQTALTTDDLPPMRLRRLWELAVKGDCDEWELEGPRYILALTGLLCQVSRVIGQGSRKAYMHDMAAAILVRATIEADEDETLTPLQRALFYVPLLLAESAPDLALAQTVTARLASQHPAMYGGLFPRLAQLASTHCDVFAQFGRFPQRNSDLDRTSTPEELEFLALP